MPRHDPIPSASARRKAEAWSHYKKLMLWMGLAATLTVLLALLFLRWRGGPMPLHMIIATIAGVGLTVLLGTGLMGLAYFSSHSGHDDDASRKGLDDE